MSRTFVVVCLTIGAALATMPVSGSPDALWLQFDRMTPAEQKNAVLSLQPSPDALTGAWDECRDICRLWNSGDCAAAIGRLRGYGRFDDPCQVTVAVSWRKPIENERPSLDSDTRIGSRDSLLDLMMDRSANGDLWAITPCSAGGQTNLYSYQSTDNGNSWRTLSWVSWGFPNYLTAWSAACNGTYNQVSFTTLGDPNRALCARIRMSDGAWIPLAGDSTAVTGFAAASGDTVRELAECSQEDTLPGYRVYLFGRTQDRLLDQSWSDCSCAVWRPHSTNVTTCDNGLDCTFSEGSTVKKLWASWLTYLGADTVAPAFGYFTTADTLFHLLYFQGAFSPKKQFEPTSITAWHDSVLLAYTGLEGRYWKLTTPDAGNAWTVGYLSPSEADTCEFPEVSGRDGGGFAAAYRARTTAANCWLEARHADLVDGPYSVPDTISEPTHRPAPTSRIRIVPLGSGSYGVGWINWDDAVYGGA
jgi:hypothetical protein